MADIEKIRKHLEDEFEYVKTYGSEEEPIWFVCNLHDITFRIVSIYLDSEIGGYFTLDESSHMAYVLGHFDKFQAKDLRDIVVEKIDNGEAIVIGNLKNEVIH